MKLILFLVLFSSFNTFGNSEFQCSDVSRLENRIEQIQRKLTELRSECDGSVTQCKAYTSLGLTQEEAVSECSKSYSRNF